MKFVGDNRQYKLYIYIYIYIYIIYIYRYDLSQYRGLAVEFVGDNRQYKLVVHADRGMDSPSYQV